jgi:hypothetical protein
MNRRSIYAAYDIKATAICSSDLPWCADYPGFRRATAVGEAFTRAAPWPHQTLTRQITTRGVSAATRRGGFCATCDTAARSHSDACRFGFFLSFFRIVGSSRSQ